MNNKDVKDFSDLELAELQGQIYQQLIQADRNLQSINLEIQRRKGEKSDDQETPPAPTGKVAGVETQEKTKS